MKAFHAVLIAIIAVVVSPLNGHAEGVSIPIFYSYGGEKLIKIVDLPQTDRFRTQSGEHIDVGYRYKQFCIFWMPVWNYDGEWCGYFSSEHYADIPKVKLEEAASEANVTLPSEWILPFGPTLGVRILLGGMLVLKVLSWIAKKLNRTTEVNSHRKVIKKESTETIGRDEELEIYTHGSWILLVACVAKFAKLDGIITRNQIATIEATFQELGYKDTIRQHAIEVFGLAKDGSVTFSESVDLFRTLYGNEGESVVALIVSLFKLSVADGEPTDREYQALKETCFRLNCDYDAFFEHFHGSASRDGNSELDEAYDVLGCLPTDSVTIIKERYRKLVKDFHPDTIASKQLPQEFTKFAEEKFNTIQQAYQAISQSRSIS